MVVFCGAAWCMVFLCFPLRVRLPFVYFQASYYIFDKLTQEGFSGMDDVRLRTSIKIPKSTVGRVIGKGGKNVSTSALFLWQIV